MDGMRQALAGAESGPDNRGSAGRTTAAKDQPTQQSVTPKLPAGGAEEPVAAANNRNGNDPYAKEDLEAQQAMARAAEWVVILTLIQSVIALFGTAAVVGALFWTIKGTKSAIQQAEAATEANRLLRSAHVAEIRPWLTLDIKPAKLFYNVNGLNLVSVITVTNIGSSPATKVWIDCSLHAPAIGLDFNFNPAAVQAKALEHTKSRPGRPYGTLLFPGKGMRQEHTVTIGKDELERLTTEVAFLHLNLVCLVGYSFAVDQSRHHTATTFEVMRTDRPREVSKEKNRSPSGIFVDEGDIGENDLVLRESYIAAAYAD